MPAIVIVAGYCPSATCWRDCSASRSRSATMLALAGMVVALDSFGPVTGQCRRHCGDGRSPTGEFATPPTRSTPLATRPRRSPRATPSARPVWARWYSLRPTRRTCASLPPVAEPGSFFDGRHGRFCAVQPDVVAGLLIGGLLPFPVRRDVE